MRKRGTKWLIVGLGAGLVLVAIPRARAGEAASAKYLGNQLCLACHRAAYAQAVSGWAASAHSRALWKIEEADGTHTVVADFSAGSPFPRDQVAYVLGAGVHSQAFLDKNLKVLPGEWAVKSKAWRPREPADATQDCLGCHSTGYDPATGKWASLGVGCEMCHGPGSAHTGSKDKQGSIVRPQSLTPDRQAMICGRCHSFGKSKDGAHPFASDFRPGDDLDQRFDLAQEVPKGVPNAQYNELRLGGGKHLASGTVCTVCHDPHGTGAGQLRVPQGQLCLSEACHGGKLTGSQHSKQAPQAASCSICHMPGGKHVFVLPRPS